MANDSVPIQSTVQANGVCDEEQTLDAIAEILAGIALRLAFKSASETAATGNTGKSNGVRQHDCKERHRIGAPN